MKLRLDKDLARKGGILKSYSCATSIDTLSVSIIAITSSLATASPTCFRHSISVPSLMLSPPSDLAGTEDRGIGCTVRERYTLLDTSQIVPSEVYGPGRF